MISIENPSASTLPISLKLRVYYRNNLRRVGNWATDIVTLYTMEQRLEQIELMRYEDTKWASKFYEPTLKARAP